jgi:hypothetical protein
MPALETLVFETVVVVAIPLGAGLRLGPQSGRAQCTDLAGTERDGIFEANYPAGNIPLGQMQGREIEGDEPRREGDGEVDQRGAMAASAAEP